MQEEKFGIATKTYMLKELLEKFEFSPNFIVTNYKGLRSAEMKMDEMAQFVKGELGIGFAGDIIAASKTFVDFAKSHDSFKLNCAMIDGKLEGLDRIKQLAMLPSRDILLGMALNRMKSPVTGFVGVLSGLLRNLVWAISEIKNKRDK